MDTMNYIADLDEIVKADLAAARRFSARRIAVALGWGALAALQALAWEWLSPAVVWPTPTLALIYQEWPLWVAPTLWFIGIAFCAHALEGFPHPGNFLVSDLTLDKLAAAKIVHTSAFSTLKSYLGKQGYITLGQVCSFLTAEQRERKRLAGLRNPGAQALLS